MYNCRDGRVSTRCATDPSARHGPYHEWSRREAGKLTHKVVSPEQAHALQQAIDNLREVQRLLERWEHGSATIILGGHNRKP